MSSVCLISSPSRSCFDWNLFRLIIFIEIHLTSLTCSFRLPNKKKQYPGNFHFFYYSPTSLFVTCWSPCSLISILQISRPLYFSSNPFLLWLFCASTGSAKIQCYPLALNSTSGLACPCPSDLAGRRTAAPQLPSSCAVVVVVVACPSDPSAVAYPFPCPCP